MRYIVAVIRSGSDSYRAWFTYTGSLIGSRALTASPKQYRYNVVAHIPLEQPDETPDTLPAS
jgi:hypothetical protein